MCVASHTAPSAAARTIMQPCWQRYERRAARSSLALAPIMRWRPQPSDATPPIVEEMSVRAQILAECRAMALVCPCLGAPRSRRRRAERRRSRCEHRRGRNGRALGRPAVAAIGAGARPARAGRDPRHAAHVAVASPGRRRRQAADAREPYRSCAGCSPSASCCSRCFSPRPSHRRSATPAATSFRNPARTCSSTSCSCSRPRGSAPPSPRSSPPTATSPRARTIRSTKRRTGCASSSA